MSKGWIANAVWLLIIESFICGCDFAKIIKDLNKTIHIIAKFANV